ncbi:MAG: 4Fe-4S binding protein [Magnetococcales bacterium]|nr:4Fe-4S binding protein [Magnetococcales bacterium]
MPEPPPSPTASILPETIATLCLPGGEEAMIHPGLPSEWIAAAVVGLLLMGWMAGRGDPRSSPKNTPGPSLHKVPLVRGMIRFFYRSPWPLVTLKIILVALFLLVILSGLWGTPLPERNLATTLTWTIWWSLVVVSVLFVGTAWCSVCPWDTLAGWLVRQRLWQRDPDPAGFDLKLPRIMRTVWPALGMLIGLTWLELGAGVTTSPVATASLALIMVVLATLSLAVFQRKSFCRYLCPVGRTLGFYAQLAPVELRPIEQKKCDECTSLACYNGSKTIEACPTFLTMGRFSQNTYCTSCGACLMSCPDHNISWRLRPMATEARQHARPHWDEAWFMLGLLALTSFHGVTMLPQWESILRWLARWIGDSGQLLISFSIGMAVCLLVPAILYGLVVAVTRQISKGVAGGYRRLFATLSFATLPVAFSYHLAHNLSHFSREGRGFWGIIFNPLGRDTLPMTIWEKHLRMLDPIMPVSVLHGLQVGLMVLGFGLAVRILRSRGAGEAGEGIRGWGLLPMWLFLGGVSGFNLWLLGQDMAMRL